MKYIWTIMRLTFHEAWRRRVVTMAMVLSAIFLILYAVGFRLITHSPHVHGLATIGADNFILLAGLYVVHFLTIVLSIFVSVDTISGEISSHTVQALVTKPMRRWQLMLGKWLGYAAMLALYTGLLTLSIMVITYWESAYVPPHPWAAIGMPMLEALVLISLSMLGGTRLSTMTNGVALFLLYGLAFIGTWVEQIGSVLQSPVAVNVGIVTSLFMPVEALWRRTAFLIQPPFLSKTNFTPFSAYSVPSESMIIYAFVYGICALALAIRAFQRRDL